jgi:hypothetical protein
MYTLRIDHSVPDFDAWKEVFDGDPVGRQQGGVRRYRIFRPIDDPNHVVVDLEFDGSGEAKAFRAALRDLWRGIEVEDAQARIVEEVESGEY